jgi:hypothetical protein
MGELRRYFDDNFTMMHFHKYSLTELENMIPWEREIYISLLRNHINEENEKIKLQNQQKRASRK